MKEVPKREQCDCCLDEWSMMVRHKHGTRGRFCPTCLSNYIMHLPVWMVKVMKVVRRIPPSMIARVK